MGDVTLQARSKEAIDSALERGLSLADIARRAGVTGSAVTQWKDGTTKSLKAKSAAGLEAATGFRVVWLITGKGPKLSNSAWPFTLFTEADFRLLDEHTKREIEDSIAGKIQRARGGLGNGTIGRI